MADDDRYVRNALKKTNRYDGEVFAKNISLSQLSTYGPLVNDLGVNQTPAVVVIDRNLKGTVLTGYVDRIAINQAIADARRDSIVPCDHGRVPAERERDLRTLQAALLAGLGADDPRQEGAPRRLGPLRRDRPRVPPRRALDAGAREVEGPEGPVAEGRSSSTTRRDAHGRVDQDREPVRRPRRLHGSRPHGRGQAKLDRRFDDAGVTACVDQPPVVDSSGRGPRAIRRAPRRAQRARRTAFRGLRRPRRRRALRRPDPRLRGGRGRSRGRGRLRRRRLRRAHRRRLRGGVPGRGRAPLRRRARGHDGDRGGAGRAVARKAARRRSGLRRAPSRARRRGAWPPTCRSTTGACWWR